MMDFLLLLLLPAPHAGAETTIQLDDYKTVQHGLHSLLVRIGRQVCIALDLDKGRRYSYFSDVTLIR
jgi:hypothetical protein